MNDQPIGICDSGIGGLTVTKEIIKSLPNENIIYIGDTARVPYGVRDKETITKFAKDLINFLIEKNVKAIVVACNTISSTCLPELEKISPVPIIGVIKPTAADVVNIKQAKVIGVIGTRATINSGSYEKELKKINNNVLVYSQACPLLVPLAEEGFVDHSATKIIAKQYLEVFKDKKLDSLILGCTHYPILDKVIRQIIDGSTVIVDPAKPTANLLRKMLTDKNILGNNGQPTYHFYFTDEAPQTHKTVNIFFDNKFPGKIEKVSL